MYYPDYSQFDTKRQILGWEAHATTSNLWQARDSGLVTQLFENGDDLGAAQGSIGAVNSDDLWHYASDIDTVFYFNDGYTSTTILDVIKADLADANKDSTIYSPGGFIELDSSVANQTDYFEKTKDPILTDNKTEKKSDDNETILKIFKIVTYKSSQDSHFIIQIL